MESGTVFKLQSDAYPWVHCHRRGYTCLALSGRGLVSSLCTAGYTGSQVKVPNPALGEGMAFSCDDNRTVTPTAGIR